LDCWWHSPLKVSISAKSEAILCRHHLGLQIILIIALIRV
jgi:hypothetical protein